MKNRCSILRLAAIGLAVGSLFNSLASSAATGEFMLKNLRLQSTRAPQTDRIIVKLRSMQPAFMARGIETAKMHNLSALAGVDLAMYRPMSGGAHVLKLPTKMSDAEAETYVNTLRSHPDVMFAEVDRLRRAELIPNDIYYAGQQVNLQGGSTFFADQWYLKNETGGMNAPAAWDITTGDPNLRIAVLDSGIAPQSEMTGRTSGGYDFIDNIPSANDGNARDNSPADPGDWVTSADITDPKYAACGFTTNDVTPSSWHGTSVAGIIGAATNNNGAGIAGINWKSMITPLRVLGKCGGFDSDISDAMRYAAGVTDPAIPNNPTPARVMNLSLGGTDANGCGNFYPSAIADAVAKNVVIVGSAGNTNIDAAGHAPAGSCPGMIAVAATGKFGERASYSNFGSKVTISAPGGNISGTTFDGSIWHIINNGDTSPILGAAGDNFATGVGTSFAAPMVTGVVSLMLSVNPNLTPAQVVSILQTKAKPFPILTASQLAAGMIQCTTSLCGAGILDAAASVAEAQRLPGAIQSNNNSGGGCSLGSVNSPADISLPLLLSMALFWRARARRQKI
jgi:serine protease